jgi:hypothetical protein
VRQIEFLGDRSNHFKFQLLLLSLYFVSPLLAVVVVTGGRRCGESSYWVVLLRGRSLVTSQSVLMEHGRAAVEIVLAERKRESLS